MNNEKPSAEEAPAEDKLELGVAPTDAKREDAPSTETSHLASSEGQSSERQSSEDPSPALNNAQSSSAHSNPSTQKTYQSDAKRKRPWFLLFTWACILVVLAALASAGYYARKIINVQARTADEFKLGMQQQQIKTQQALNQLHNTQQEQSAAVAAQLSEARERLDDADRRIAAQNKRLRAMSTTSREDWLLAEAEYLLKLANQRVRIEKSSAGADALLSEADGILRDLDEPDLFFLRRAIASDLAALRLAPSIDVSGLYFTLVALAENIAQVPLRLDRAQQLALRSDDNGVASDPTKDAVEPSTFWTRMKISFNSFVNEFQGYYRITRHEQKPQPLLPPKEAYYLPQNLRVILERAQIALLREQQDIYEQSLQQADTWLSDYYPASQQSKEIQKQLRQLKSHVVERQLPDISTSHNLLHDYIKQLHDLGGVKTSVTNEKKSSSAAGGK
jgi:uroporphyrin-3 C-methyltransferase